MRYKYNWAKAVGEFRKILIENVKLVGNNDAHTADLAGYFRMMVKETDTFHPWNSDGELSRALDKLPKRCDYRSLRIYNEWKSARLDVEDAIYEMLEECSDQIRDHFADAWNFPPGYVKPKEIKIKWDNCDISNVAGKSFPRIVRVARIA